MIQPGNKLRRLLIASFFLIISVGLTINFTSSTPVEAQTSSFRFVAWGDTKNSTDDLKTLSRQVVNLNQSPVFTIYAGDLEDSGFSSSGMAKWKTAVNGGENNGIFDKTFAIRGNHDAKQNKNGWQNYFDFAGMANQLGGSNYSSFESDLTYSFDYGNSHFVGVDVAGSVGQLSQSEIDWLDSDLYAAESRGLKHAFLFWHGPIYCIDGHCNCSQRDCGSSNTVKNLVKVLNKHPIVSATLHGHEHTYAHIRIDNTRVSEVTCPFEEFVTGAAGAGPKGCTSGRTDYCMAQDGFTVFDVSGDNVQLL